MKKSNFESALLFCRPKIDSLRFSFVTQLLNCAMFSPVVIRENYFLRDFKYIFESYCFDQVGFFDVSCFRLPHLLLTVASDEQ